MSAFRELVDEMDDTVFDVLSDDAEIDGRSVRGMFSAPWLAPQIGKLNTGIVEPQLAVRDADAAGIEKGASVKVFGLGYEVVAIEPDGTGVTTLVLRPAAP